MRIETFEARPQPRVAPQFKKAGSEGRTLAARSRRNTEDQQGA